jgi:hypothetical protein
MIRPFVITCIINILSQKSSSKGKVQRAADGFDCLHSKEK